MVGHRLIALFTNLFFFQRWSFASASPAPIPLVAVTDALPANWPEA